MSANIPTSTIQPIPESPPDTDAAIRSWRIMVARAINFLLKGVTGTPITSVGNAAYSILPSDRVVETSVVFTAARIWTLPAANSIGAGTEIAILDAIATVTNVNTLSVARLGADTINGGAGPIVLNAAGTALTLVSNGLANWAVKSRYL